ncbi:8729_t:CDS:2 [Paraglomus brasilianum]|uniref:8729_t:CDS:1 n=1 Tax=Paraglomus brasilianum TaxID=144538 RepID=A0A9N9GFX1_9GLOM|nr:8729_t:CDS:2 [Paraglomus brasilianum]
MVSNSKGLKSLPRLVTHIAASTILLHARGALKGGLHTRGAMGARQRQSGPPQLLQVTSSGTQLLKSFTEHPPSEETTESSKSKTSMEA